MDLSKKTTILFPPDLHKHLMAEAARRGMSFGQLVREACETKYGHVSSEDRLAAVADMATMALPVADVRRMKEESVPSADEPTP